MWKLFSQNDDDPAVYLKVEIYNEKTESKAPEDQARYKIIVTNFINLWSWVYDNENMIQMMLKSNKGIESDDKQGFLHAGLRMLNNPKMIDQKEFYQTQNGDLNVRFLCKGAIVLKMNFTLTLCSPEEYFHLVTRPLMAIIGDQNVSERQLRHELIRKDYEIKGFVNMLPENSPLMRCLRTTPYDDEAHVKNHSIMEKVFGTDPVERVTPSHVIRCGRPLPIQPSIEAHMKEETKKQTTQQGKPSKATETKSSIQKVIETKPIDLKGDIKSQGTPKIQIPTVKIEPKDDTVKPMEISGPNKDENGSTDVKDEPKDTNGPKDVIGESGNSTGNPKMVMDEKNIKSDVKEWGARHAKGSVGDSDEDTIDPNSTTVSVLIDSKPQTDNTYDSLTKSQPTVPDSHQPTPISTDMIQTEEIEPKLEQDTLMTSVKRSPEIKSDAKTDDCTSAKKRRKNLNY